MSGVDEEENRPDGDRERRNGEATGRTGPLDLLEDVVAIFLKYNITRGLLSSLAEEGRNEKGERERGKPPRPLRFGKTERNNEIFENIFKKSPKALQFGKPS